MLGYLIIIKDTVPTIIGFDEGIQRELVMIITTLLPIIPVSVKRDIVSLESASIISIFCEFFILVYVVSYSPVLQNIKDQGGFWEILKHYSVSSNVFVGLGILSDAMCCQHSGMFIQCNMLLQSDFFEWSDLIFVGTTKGFLIYGSLYKNNRKRRDQATCYSISTATIISFLLGKVGYLGFLENVQADSLNNFPSGSIQANVARGLLAITMYFSYPMVSLVYTCNNLLKH